MKILHFTQNMAAGGVEAIICNLLNELVRSEQNDVTLGTIYAVDQSQVYEQKLDSRVKRISLGKTSKGISLRLILKLYKIIKNGGYDVVHIHGWFYYFLLPVIFLHRQTKFFYTIHSDAKMENTPMDLKILKFKTWCFKKRFIYPITISKPSQHSFSNLYGTESKLIYNGVKKYSGADAFPLYHYKITPKTKVFIHPARISPEKNQLVLVKVFDRLIKEGKDVVLLIAGQKRNEKVFAKIEPYFNDRIRYIGVRSDVPQLMKYSFGFCLPSIWEGLPVTLLESLSTGCIPICAPVGGIVEVVKSGYNGFLSKSSNEEDYYETMCQACLLDSTTSEIISSNCIQSFEKFDITRTAKDYYNYYCEKISS